MATFAKDVKDTVLLDVTIRDGGYVNGHSWTTEQAEHVVRTCAAAGVPNVEVGYLRPRRHAADGAELPSASCPPAYLERLQQAAGAGDQHPGLVVMAHAADIRAQDLVALAPFGVRMVRMPTRPDSVAALAPFVEAVHGTGMAFAVNLIRVSELAQDQVLAAAEQAERIGADVFYLADSNGSLFPDQVARLSARVREAAGLTLGFHAHDGISMAFANALAAAASGFSHIDASMGGMGKGGGNLALELITAYLRSCGRIELQFTPLAEAVPTLLAPWKGGRLRAWCEAIAGGILDLNLESLEAIRADELTTVFSLLDGLETAR